MYDSLLFIQKVKTYIWGSLQAPLYFANRSSSIMVSYILVKEVTMEREKDEKLELAISQGLDDLSPDDENYCDKVKAVKDLYEVKIKEEQRQDEYYMKSTELDNKSAEVDAPWWKKINPNTVITTAAMGIGTLITLKYEKDGYLFKPGEFLRSFIGHNK